jgi:hypothetical protein
MPAAIPNDGPKKSQSAATPAPATPAKAKRHWWRWLLAIFVVLLLIAFFLPNIIALPFVRQPLIDRTFTRLNAKANIKSLSLGWFSPVSLSGFDMQVEGTVDNTLSIEQIRSEESLAHLLLGSQFGAFKIDKPQLYIEFNQDGNNLTRLLKALQGAAIVNKPISFDITDARLLLRGPNTENPWALSGLNLNVDMAPAKLSPTCVHVLHGKNAQIMKETELTPEMCNDLLKFVVPPFASAVRTSGRVSLVLEEFNWPLGKPDTADLKGTLTLHSVTVGVTDIAKSITSFLHLPEMTGSMEIAKDDAVPFTMHDGRVYHENLFFTLPIMEPGLLVRSHGSVGLDETLDWYVELTLPADADLAASPLLRTLRDSHPTIHFTGTLTNRVMNVEGAPGAAAVLGAFGESLKRRIERRNESARPSLLPNRRQPDPNAPTNPSGEKK